MPFVSYKLGAVTVYPYGVFVAAGFIAASALIIKSSLRYGLPKEKIYDCLFLILISGVLGARLLHVVLNASFYLKNPAGIIMLHKGGLAMQGATAAAIFAAVLFLKKNSLPLWKAGDLIMLYLPVAQAIGRLGCFFRGCCFGKPAASFLGVKFFDVFAGRHPTQLYYFFELIAVFFALRHVSLKRRLFDGEVFILYFLIDSPARFALDFLRGDLSVVWAGLMPPQIISAIFFFAALAVYMVKYGKIRNKGRKEGR